MSEVLNRGEYQRSNGVRITPNSEHLRQFYNLSVQHWFHQLCTRINCMSAICGYRRVLVERLLVHRNDNYMQLAKYLTSEVANLKHTVSFCWLSS